jgi:hypothetical protein
MSTLATWDPYNQNVQGGIRQNDYVNGQFLLACAGPPKLSQVAGGFRNSVYPIGLLQNLSMSQGKQWTRIFEIGSDRTYWMPGRSSGQLTFARAWLEGPSLLRVMYAYYQDSLAGKFPHVQSLLTDPQYAGLEYPYKAGAAVNGLPQNTGALHDIQIPPGYENLYLNFASDLFSQTFGLLLMFRTAALQTVGAYYVENCVAPSHGWGTDAQGLIYQESLSVQFERATPVNVNSIALLRGTLEGSGTPAGG